ncbi:MAG: DUF3854 domain-containing protein [Cyanobacteriota bacterium]|nr:DUF3854 domain-containing protein [Cyanobacteriota bacterium]
MITAKPPLGNFDIRNFIGHLTKGKKGRYECPVCNEVKLSINRMTAKYNCYSCHDTKGIAAKLREIAGEIQEENKQDNNERPVGILDPIALRHKEEFRKSAIPDTWARWNFKTLEDKNEIAKFLGWKAYKNDTGWICTGIDPVTGEDTGLGQFKPDKIIVFPKGEDAKYLTQKKGYEVICPRVPTKPNYWQDVIDDEAIAIRLTEGTKKAVASMAHTEMPTIAGCGVEMFLKDGQLTPIMQQFLQPGRMFEIAFDADIVRKVEVRQALFKLAKALLDAGCLVKVRTWDEEYGKGIDDVIFNGHNFDDVSESLTLRAQAQKWERQFPDENIRDKNQSPPKQTVFINQLVEKYREKLAYDPKLKIWLHYGAENDGIWAQEEDVFICRMLKNEVDVNYPKGCSASYIEGALRALKWELVVRKWDEDKGLLPLQNGVLRLSDKKLLKHSPKYHLTWCLPYSYEPTRTCEPIVEWFKEMIGEPDQIELLRCYLAAIVRGDSHLHRFVELIGPGGTGKSTFTSLAIALVGQNNTHSTTLNKLEKSRFETANIANKRLVVINDSERYGGDVSTLKALTGSDYLPYEVKFKQSGGGFLPNALVIMAANEPIQSGDYTSGLKRRRISLKFTNQIPNNRQRNLINIGAKGVIGDWVDYLPGLLNWVLAAKEKTIFNFLKRTDEFCPSLKRHQINSLLDSNPLADWADQHLVIKKDFRSSVGVAKQDKRTESQTRYWNVDSWLYASYSEHSFNTGTKSVAIRRFGTLLEDLLKNQLGLDVEKGRDRKGSYFKGIDIRKETDLDPLLVSNNPVDEPPHNQPPSGPGGLPPSDPSPSGPDLGSPTQDVTDNVTDDVTAETLVRAECDGCDDKLVLIPTELEPTPEPPTASEVVTEVQLTTEVQPTVNDSDPYKEAGLTPLEVSELERLAKAETDSSTPKTQSDSIKRLKVGGSVRLTDGRHGCIEFVDRSKNECWVKVQFQGTTRIKEPYTVKMPFENIKN